MSSQSTLVTRGHFDYLAERTRREDAFLRDLKRDAEEAGIPAIWISAEQASFMQILLRLAGARTVVEVGTLAGYSAISMARALPPGGLVRTIEIEPEYAAFARERVARSDVADRVEVVAGAGAACLPTFPDGWADAAFIDADKPGYATYLEQCLRILRPGGLVMVDNAFAFGLLLDEAAIDPDVRAVRAFNDRMAAMEGLQSVIVPLGDGLWVGVRK